MTRIILFKILGVLAGLVFLVVGIDERRTMSRIKSRGELAVVDPINTYTKSRSGYSSTFTFKTKDGRQISRRSSFPSELVKDFESGVPVRVYYDTTSPNDFVFEKDSPSWFLIAVGIGLGIAALLFL